jgi:hypothetical protein
MTRLLLTLAACVLVALTACIFKRAGKSEKTTNEPATTIYSVRVGTGYRGMGLREADQIYWFWIGTHAEYDQLLKRL